MKRLTKLLTLTLTCALLLGSCGDRMVIRELDELELIRVIAVDMDDEQSIRVTVNGRGVSGQEASVFSSSAHTVGTALAQMQTLSEKYLFFGHADAFLLGEQAARTKFDNYQDYLTRDVSIRLGMRCFVIKGSTAAEAVEKFGAGSELDKFIDGLERDLKLMSEAYAFTLGDIASGIAETGAALATALEFKEEPGVISGAANPTLVTAGYGVFTDEGLAAFLTKEQSRSVNIIINRFEQGHFEVPDGHESIVGLAVNDAKTTVEPIWKNDELTELKLRVKLQAAIEECDNEMDITDAETLEYVKLRLQEKVAAQMFEALGVAQELGADFLMLGTRVNLKNPVKFAPLREDWPELLKTMPVRLEITVDLERTFDLTQPMGDTKAELGENEK